jgi:hypothetical protein
MKKYLGCFMTILTVLLARLMPFNSILGSMGFYFSWSTMVAPIIAQYAGIYWMGLFLISFKSMTWPALFMHGIHRLPLLGSAVAYQRHGWITSIMVPFVCMIMFVMHEVGSQAWPYSLYWLIPMVLWWMPNNIVTRALSASLVAHAIGSVIWLYTGTIPVAIWINLIPVVAVERLLISAGIIVCDYIATKYQLVYQSMIRSMRIARFAW